MKTSRLRPDFQLEAVILAAGQGARMGAAKPLVRFEGLTFLARVSEALARSEAVARTSVVVGAYAEAVTAECRRLALPVIPNPAYETGLLSSLQAAIHHVLAREAETGRRCDALLVSLADQPLVKAKTLQALKAAYISAPATITLLRPTYRGRPGNPCVLGREHFEEILAQRPRDQGAAFLFAAHPSRVHLVEVDDPGVSVDFDRPADLPAPPYSKGAFPEIVSQTAATLAVVEVGLGGLLQGLKLPLAGHLLSLNQGFFLSRAAWRLQGSRAEFKAPFYISQILALLKSLSPASNKLGPMLSISMQGFLFSMGIVLFGANAMGILLGMVALSVWAFIQPAITLYVFYGHDLVTAGIFYLEKMQKAFGATPQTIGVVLAVAVALKAGAAAGVGWLATRLPESEVVRFMRLAERRAGSVAARFAPAPATTIAERIRLTLRDLRRPFFLLSLALMGVFFAFSEGTGAGLVWVLLRPLAIAFLFYYLSRSPLFGRLAERLRRHPRCAEFMSLYDRTLERLRAPS